MSLLPHPFPGLQPLLAGHSPPQVGMSGAEPIAVLGLISAIIGIVDATKKVYDAATN